MPRITGQGRIVIITVSIHISSELPIFLLPNLVLLYIIIDRSKYFGYGQLRPLRPACTHSQNRRESMQPESVRLSTSVSVPFFQRRHGSYCAKPTRIRSGWPGQGLAKRIWSGSKLVCRNHLARFLAGRNRPTTSFPLSDAVPFFYGRPG